MSRYGSGCEDCVRCTVCGEVAYCLSEPGTRPCAHDKVLCGECNLEGCQDCRLEAEREMYEAGEYKPEADPFYDHRAKAADEAVAAHARNAVEVSASNYRFPGDPRGV